MSTKNGYVLWLFEEVASDEMDLEFFGLRPTWRVHYLHERAQFSTRESKTLSKDRYSYQVAYDDTMRIVAVVKRRDFTCTQMFFHTHIEIP